MERAITVEISGRVAGGVRATERTLGLAALFGLAVEASAERRLFEETRLTIGPGEVVLITGPSGSGKSTLLRRAVAELRATGEVRVMNLEEIDLRQDVPLVDTFACSLEETLGHLARAGLSEARVLLRTAAELSEGERFRYRLARFFASEADVLAADEFAATLDRVTARVVAYQLGKFVRASAEAGRPRGAIVATTHEDLAEDLQPARWLRQEY